MTYNIISEDATRYLPHNPTGVEYQHFVYRDDCPFVCFSGTRRECEGYIAKVTGANDHRQPGELGGYHGNR